MPVTGENREKDLIEGRDSKNLVKAQNFDAQEEFHQMDLMLDHHLVMSLQTDLEQAREFWATPITLQNTSVRRQMNIWETGTGSDISD